MTRQEVLDLYFMEARSKVIDLAAFLDRIDRSAGEADFRLAALKDTVQLLSDGKSDRARRVLLALSDHSLDPIPAATTKAACGAPIPVTHA